MTLLAVAGRGVGPVCEAATSSSYPKKASLPDRLHLSQRPARAVPLPSSRRHRPLVPARPSARSRGACVSLRIAVLAPVAWRVPPRHYGPWEQFASLLTEGLVSRGVDVTLFASADSVTGAHLASAVAQGWEDDAAVEPKVAECLHISAVFERAREFD